jgi:hypothetical protein
MTITKQLIISCDAPECADDDGYTAASESYMDARIEAMEHGWAERRGRDYCPRHSGP